VNRIDVDPQTAQWALVALERMLALPARAPRAAGAPA
jgi:quinolinate synthase